MSLFNTKDIKEPTDATHGISETFNHKDNKQAIVIGKGTMAISELLKKDFEENDCIHYISDGCWSMHHLAEYILNKIGPSHIHLATWSISEYSARKLCQWLLTGNVRSINGVLDFRSKNRHAEAFYLAKQSFTTLKLANCHAKITVIHNNSYTVVINGSPNWTENPRLENGTITISKTMGKKYIDLINQIIEKSEYELE